MPGLLIDQYVNRPKSNTSTDASNAHFLRRYAELLSDVWLKVPLIEEMQIKASMGVPTWLFVEQYSNVAQFPATWPIPGVYHANEALYVYDSSHPSWNLTADDYTFQAQLAQIIGSFVKTGVPTLTGVTWPSPTSARTPPPYLGLKPSSPSIIYGYPTESMDFWTNTVPSTMGNHTTKNSYMPATKLWLNSP